VLCLVYEEMEQTDGQTHTQHHYSTKHDVAVTTILVFNLSLE